MKKTFLALVVLFCSNFMMSQMDVDNTPTPEDVANMLVGEGVTITNITYEGSEDQFGSWVSDGTDIGIDEGIIMATGDCLMAEGPNDQGGATLGGGAFGASDPDLTAVSGVTTNDKAILEFDFVPLGTTVSFRYVFGSEEYDGFECCSVNDAFGFFISGPGIVGPYSSPSGFPDGSINIALIPDTDIGVSINTVNSGEGDCAETNCADLDPNWQNNTVFFTNNDGGVSVQYDGFTVVLTATVEVVCGETYHLKLGIADGGDTILDSGVFLESGSLNASAGEIAVNIESEGFELGPNELIEGCLDASINIIRASCNESDTINLSVNGSATMGTDYNNLVTQIIFDESENSYTFDITPNFDGITEGAETIELSFEYDDGLGNLDTAYAVITLYDYIDMELTVDDLYLCPGESGSPQVNIDHGAPTYIYDWSDGQTGPGATFDSDDAGSFNLTVSDQCGFDVLAGFQVIDPPSFNVLDPEPYYCIGQSTPQMASGGSPSYLVTFEADSLQLVGQTGFTAIYEGVYDVTIWDQCDQSESIELIFQNCGTVIPNIFSPNNDDFNEVFFIDGLASFPNSKLYVYNRWGKLIYEDSNYENDWDGEDFAEGTYYYILERSDGENFSGYFNIVR